MRILNVYKKEHLFSFSPLFTTVVLHSDEQTDFLFAMFFLQPAYYYIRIHLKTEKLQVRNKNTNKKRRRRRRMLIKKKKELLFKV